MTAALNNVRNLIGIHPSNTPEATARMVERIRLVDPNLVYDGYYATSDHRTFDYVVILLKGGRSIGKIVEKKTFGDNGTSLFAKINVFVPRAV